MIGDDCGGHEEQVAVGALDFTVKKSPSNSLRITPICTNLIRPATPTVAHYITLSNLDLIALPVYSTLILLYKPNEEQRQCQVVQALRESLSRVLVEFYPMAGRLVLKRNSSNLCLPTLHCNDAGVVFTEASADANIELIQDFYPIDQLLGIPENEAGPGPFYPARDANGVPALAIQATSFRGGVAVSVAWHHNVADGNSCWNFLRSWAELSRGESISLLPCFTRSLLQPRHPPSPTVPCHGYKVRMETKQAVEQLHTAMAYNKESTKTIDLKELSLNTTSGMVLRKFQFSKENVESLRREASEVGRSFSSAVSLSAHLWKSLTRARELDEEQEVRFSLTVDGRTRIPLPAGFFGNCTVWACATSTVKELLSRPLSYAAESIHTAIASRTGEFYRSLVDFIALHIEQNVHWENRNVFKGDAGATFWTQMKLYELDFGWGRPVHAGRNVIPRKALDYFFAIMPSPSAGAMIAYAYLNDNDLKRLEKDPTFCPSS